MSFPVSRITAEYVKFLNRLVLGSSEALRLSKQHTNLLESAISRPSFLVAYKPEQATAPRLAAELAVGVIQNHPFPDGNKRTAFLMVNEYLRDAGKPLVDNTPENIAADPEVMKIIGTAHDRVATNDITAEELARIYVDVLSRK